MPYKDPEARRANDLSRRLMAREASCRCPECGDRRSTTETLRVHRWLAHDVRVAS